MKLDRNQSSKSLFTTIKDKIMLYGKNKTLLSICILLGLIYGEIATAGTAITDLTTMTNQVRAQLVTVFQVIMAICYVAGGAMTLTSLILFKAHKDNPTQNPLGKPIAYLFIGVSLIYTPQIINVVGGTVFNFNTSSNKTTSENISSIAPPPA